MKKYHKINTIFKRDLTNKGKIIEGEYSSPYLKMLKDIHWVGTEKIHGTNIRIMWDGEQVRFGGKTNNAQIQTSLLLKLQDTFTNELMSKVFPKPELVEGQNDPFEVCLYGEGFGVRIQKGGGRYIPDGIDFILFDVKVGCWWLTRTAVGAISYDLGINVVPVVFEGTLEEAVEFTRKGFTSKIAIDSSYIAEGLVLRPVEELADRAGKRIITKIKYQDFR